MPLRIDLPVILDLSRVMESAFNNAEALEPMLLSLGDNIAHYGGMRNQYGNTLINLAKAYNDKYAIDQLIVAMLRFRFDNGDLIRFAERFNISIPPPGAQGEVVSQSVGLERMLDPQRGFRD